uniref:ADP ribosylation factor like GTPase 14 effector protein n=1 Tax=Cairina moschata TaxID=8855 RepID=A0A8C3BXD1_CAIMO
MDPCSVGVQLQAANECHKTYYTRHTGFKTKQDISSSDLLLLQLRTGMALSENNTICFHHAKIYIERFEDLQKSCCDPFNMHRKLSKKNLRAIDLDDATFLSAKFGRQFVPGWKLCPKCMQVINGSVDVESEERQRRKLDSDGRTAKALKSLQFANPGRQTEFTPETSKREKRRLQSKTTSFNSDSASLTSRTFICSPTCHLPTAPNPAPCPKPETRAHQEAMVPVGQTDQGRAAELKPFSCALETHPYLDNWRNNK